DGHSAGSAGYLSSTWVICSHAQVMFPSVVHWPAPFLNVNATGEALRIASVFSWHIAFFDGASLQYFTTPLLMCSAMCLASRKRSAVVRLASSTVILSGQPHDALNFASASATAGTTCLVMTSRSSLPAVAVSEM